MYKSLLDILDLLGIKQGIVAITKKDLVDDEWLSLVKSEVEELLAPTILSQAPIIAVSAITGEGLDDLVSAIDELLNSIAPKKDIGRPRLPIDRVFTIAGSGTVVTGTLIDGSLTVGQEVEIVPSGLRSRLRGLQTHKARINTATPGSRVGANLVGIATSQLQRGDVLTKPDWLKPTMMSTVQLRLLPYLRRPLPHNITVSFHSGAAEALAKVRLLEKDELPPGETTLAQLALSKPVAIVKGDHFIIRSTVETLGGGEIIEPHTRRYRRYRPDVIHSLIAKEQGTVEQVIMATLEAKPSMELPALSAQCDLPAAEVQPAIDSLIQQGKIIGTGQGKHRLLFAASRWELLTKQVTGALQNYHQRFPTRPGMPKAELSSRIKMGAQASAVLQRLLKDGIVIEDGSAIRLPTHRVQLTQAQQTKIDTFLNALARNPYAPPSDLIPEPDLLNLLIEQKRVVKVSDDVVFSTSAYNEMVKRITAHIKASGKVTVGEVRDMFQTSRKYVLALLEHLDRAKVTRRVGDERVLG